MVLTSLGILITGGQTDGRPSNRAEIYNLETLGTCTLKSMSSPRFQHAQVNNLVCGGGDDTKKTCETFRNGEWHHSHTLLQNRSEHSVWPSPNGVILIGGEDFVNFNKTEKLQENGNSIESFSIDGKFAKYIHFFSFFIVE